MVVDGKAGRESRADHHHVDVVNDVLPLGPAVSAAHEMTTHSSIAAALAATGVHTGAMLAVTGAVAVAVYEWLGLGFLRWSWINFDLVWVGALVVAGIILIGGF